MLLLRSDININPVLRTPACVVPRSVMKLSTRFEVTHLGCPISLSHTPEEQSVRFEKWSALVPGTKPRASVSEANSYLLSYNLTTCIAYNAKSSLIGTGDGGRGGKSVDSGTKQPSLESQLSHSPAVWPLTSGLNSPCHRFLCNVGIIITASSWGDCMD